MLFESENLAEAFLKDLEPAQTMPTTGTVTPFYPPAESEEIEVSTGPQSWHKTLANLLLEGYTNEDAARMLGKSVATIVHLKATDWFKQLVSQISIQHFKGDPKALLAGAATEAILTLEVIARTGKSESSRVSAAKTLLDAYNKSSIAQERSAADERPHDPQMREAELDRAIEEAERLLQFREAKE